MVSYSVFTVIPEVRVSPEYVKNQRIATLLTQLKSNNENSAKGTLEFLSDTVSGYSNFRKLDRYLALSKKTDRTDEENELMQEIRSIEALKAYLPQG